MDYIQGFNDAVEYMTKVTNKAIIDLRESNYELSDLERVIDNFVSATYVLQLQAQINEDEFIDCLECDKNYNSFNTDLEYEKEHIEFWNILSEEINNIANLFETLKGED